MTYRFHLLGAYDRFNYGDLLFAHISEQLVRDRWPEARITHYGTHASDLRGEGGVVTQPLKKLVRTIRQQPDDNHVILLTGGEILATQWWLTVEHQASPGVSTNMKRIRRRLGDSPVDAFHRFFSGTPWDLPWVPDPDSLEPARHVQVLYNSVGGGAVGVCDARSTAWQKKTLPKASWLSVRDAESAERIADLGLPRPTVSPDSAVIMASLPNAAALKDDLAGIAMRMARGALPSSPFICVQCGANYFRGQEDLFAAQVAETHKRTGLPIVSFAIGRAAGHEDHLVARKLETLLGAPAWFRRAPEDMSVWEIMSLIAGSALYIGTSLHGFITAFAFARPHMGLHPRVAKITGFRDAWDLPEAPAGVPFEQMAENAVSALTLPPEAMAEKASAAAKRFRADAEQMLDSLKLPVSAS